MDREQFNKMVIMVITTPKKECAEFHKELTAMGYEVKQCVGERRYYVRNPKTSRIVSANYRYTVSDMYKVDFYGYLNTDRKPYYEPWDKEHVRSEYKTYMSDLRYTKHALGFIDSERNELDEEFRKAVERYQQRMSSLESRKVSLTRQLTDIRAKAGLKQR